MNAFRLAAMLTGLAGCSLVPLLPGVSAVPTSSPTPGGGPSTRWVTGPAALAIVKVGTPRIAGLPVTVTVRTVVGSSSCNRPGGVESRIDREARKVTLSAAVETLVADREELACTADFRVREATVSLEFPEAGTWSLEVDRWSEALAGFSETDAASMAVEVTEASPGITETPAVLSVFLTL